MLEHDVRIFTNKFANVSTQTTPFTFVVRVVIIPELIVRGLAVDDVLATHLAKDRSFFIRRNNSDGDSTTVEDVLQCIGANATRCAPDENNIALLHVRAIL